MNPPVPLKLLNRIYIDLKNDPNGSEKNGFPLKNGKIPCLLFADDCLLYREIKNNQDQIDMQRDLDALMDWGSTWGMKFNAKKCNIMRVSLSRKPLQHFYSLGNEILQEVSDAKYLAGLA